ncbi:histidine phosphatase family protein [Candidatus Thorarchaeota archaeon]|nr:MAG: histidine phosphatase family protein [Candidatus Thorarchaeota archaeon]
MTDWDTEEWTYAAKQLIEWVASVDSQQPLLLMFRHSHREILHTYEDTMGQGLTELGKRVSVELGRKIPTTRKVHIFLSVVPRCVETAEAISEGFSAEGGEIVDMDGIATLIGPEYTDRAVWNNLHPNGENVTEFVNQWAGGEYEGIEPFDEFSVRLMDDTVKRLVNVKDNMMHLHVTHDLAMMCTKRILFNRPLTRKDRVPFLGGLGITVNDGKPILFTAGETTILDPSL